MNSESAINEIIQLITSIQGDVSVCFKNIRTNELFLYNQYERFNTASLMKVIVGLELILRIEKGDFTQDDKIEIINSFTSKFDNSKFKLCIENDSEKELYTKIGSRIRIIELLELMIAKSSNLATNNLFNLVDKDNALAQLISNLQLYDTQILRGVEDQKAFDAGIINYTNAMDVLKLFEFINEGILLENKSLILLYEILKRQEHNSIIPKMLPKELEIAHKTGTIKSVIHDAGIIKTINGINYILVILSKNLVDMEKSISNFTMISQKIYYLVKDNKTYLI